MKIPLQKKSDSDFLLKHCQSLLAKTEKMSITKSSSNFYVYFRPSWSIINIWLASKSFRIAFLSDKYFDVGVWRGFKGLGVNGVEICVKKFFTPRESVYFRGARG